MYQGPKYKRDVNPKENASVLSIITYLFTYDIFRKGFKKELQEADVYEILKDFRSSDLGDELEEEWEKEAVKERTSFTRVLWRVYGKTYAVCGVLKLVPRLASIFTVDIFRRGCKNELQEDDIYDVLRGYGSNELGNELEEEWRKEAAKEKKSFTRVLLRVYGGRYGRMGFFKLWVRTADMYDYFDNYVQKISIIIRMYFRFVSSAVFRIIKPLGIGKLVTYFSQGPKTLSESEAYMYAGLLIFTMFFTTIFNHAYMLYVLQLAQKIRISICSLMYRKALKLSTTSLQEVTNGKIVTLMAKDVAIFDSVANFTNDIWIGLVQIVVMGYIMYRQIGVAAIVGVGFLICLSPVQMIIAKVTTTFKLKTLARSDERIRLIQEILSTIQIIKIYTWEKYFSKLVDNIRKSEVAKLRIMYYLKVTILTIGHFSVRLSFYISIITYTIFHQNITAETAFIVLGCYSSLQYVLNLALPIGISQLAETKSSIKRIKKFLLAEEAGEIVHDVNENTLPASISASNLSVEIKTDETILRDINLSLQPNLYAVTGVVGSGKSTLLKLFLEDFKITKGSLQIIGSISYASQDPWLFPGTIRQNILFGLPHDSNRYKKVVQVCGLQADLDGFSKGDNTLVSDRGLNLSKGQQARINLARAVYKKADIYLLDNPLSALDANVSKQVFQSCVKEFLGKKLCIIVMHQVQYLQEVDAVIVMKDGTVDSYGTYEKLVEEGVAFGTDLVEDYAKDDAKEDEKIINESANASETSSLLRSTTEMDGEAAKLYSETKKEGKVAFSIYKTYFYFAGGFKTIPVLIILCLIEQGFSSGFDYFISYWINVEEQLYVMRANGTNVTDYQDLITTRSRIPIYYTVLISGATTLALVNAFYMFILVCNANKKLHFSAFVKILQTHMSFFDVNLSGNILNRFSKDVSVIDEYIPFLLFQCLKLGLILLGVMYIMTTVKIAFLFLTLGLAAVLFICRTVYVPVSRSLRRIDGVTRSPVIGHLNASLEGLITIRASGAQEILKHQFDKHQDLNSSTAYMYLSTNRAFAFVLEMISSLYISSVILILIIFSGTSAGKVGMAITQSFGLAGILQYGMRQWAELENQMTSVERVLEYTEAESEDTSGDRPTDWPTDGKIVYSDVQLKYPKTNELILKGISFTVEPGQKIGIIGRTGAGKTSIISALFRLYPTESGSIVVDGRNIDDISLETVRSRLSIIPQNPVLFSGTLRSNLDPYAQFSDAVLWKALEEVNIKALVSNMDMQLDGRISEGGSNFSAGQRQLICLARAIIRNNKIIVLDEATANIDPNTDILIQETIQRTFAKCTILTIAHRLNSVLKADKVMVVNNGAITEFGDPNDLLNDKNSAFYYLVSQSGLLKI